MASGPSVPRRKAGHMAAPTSSVRKVNKPLAKPEPSTHGASLPPVFSVTDVGLGMAQSQAQRRDEDTLRTTACHTGAARLVMAPNVNLDVSKHKDET